MNTYNGWTNKETFDVALLVCNIEHLVNAVKKYDLTGEGILHLIEDVGIGVSSGINTAHDSIALAKLVEASPKTINWNEIVSNIKGIKNVYTRI